LNKKIFSIGVLFGLIAVVLGAFGAHGLQNLVETKAVESFKTGVTYQMYHAFFLMILASTKQLPVARKKLVFYLIVIGTLLFSVSIYLLATNSLTVFDFKKIALITPLGGTVLISGWLVLAVNTYKNWSE